MHTANTFRRSLFFCRAAQSREEDGSCAECVLISFCRHGDIDHSKFTGGAACGFEERARRNRRSLNQEVIAELAAIPGSGDDVARLAESRERMRRVTADIDGVRNRMTGFMSAEEIDTAIEEGRR